MSHDSTGSLEAFFSMVAAQVANPERLAAVGATGLASNTDDPAFDRIARLASRLRGAPFGFVTLVDDHHSNWLACVGMPSDDRSERHTRVEESFCQYVVGLGDVLLIDDARSDARTRHNPSIESMGVVAWAGAPLRSTEGDVLGTESSDLHRPTMRGRHPREGELTAVRVTHFLGGREGWIKVERPSFLYSSNLETKTFNRKTRKTRGPNTAIRFPDRN